MSNQKIVKCDSGLGCGESYVDEGAINDRMPGLDWMRISASRVPVVPGERCVGMYADIDIGPHCVAKVFDSPQLLIDILRRRAREHREDEARRNRAYEENDIARVARALEKVKVEV